MKIGFIGSGNMASAIMKGIVDSELFMSSEIIASDLSETRLEKIKNELNVEVSNLNVEVARVSEIVVLAVKPKFYPAVINEIKDEIKDNTIIITIAPGLSLEYIASLFEKKLKIIRTMPNTPAMVGAGMTAMCHNDLVSEDEVKSVKKILSAFSVVEIVPEYLMDAVVAVSGSSPAYVYMFIEAMADAAVLKGMPRNQAYTFAAQAVLGSAKMVLDTGKHPGELKDMVCSPAGTTIEAVRSLEKTGFRSSVIEAMINCANKCSGA